MKFLKIVERIAKSFRRKAAISFAVALQRRAEKIHNRRVTKKRKIVLILLSLAIFVGVGALIFSTRRTPRREMRELAPADAAVYLESSDLPQIFQAFTENETWRELAPQFGIEVRQSFARSYLTAIFASDALKIAERGQFAVVLDSFEATETDAALRLKPRLTVIADTHISESANIAEFEKLLDSYAAKYLSNAERSNTSAENFRWTIWRENGGERRIFLAVRQNLVYIGNDESALKKCLAAGRGETPNLLHNEQLSTFINEAEIADAAAYGFISPAGIKQISEILTVAYAGKIVENETAMRVLAETAPRIAQNFAQSIGWKMRRADGRIEDVFFIKNAPQLNENLREPLQTSVDVVTETTRFIPPESVGFSFYNVQNPANAWNALVRETARPLDAVGAIFVTQNAKTLLEPYGIAAPNDFFPAVGNEILTIQTDDGETSTAAVFRVKNREKIRAEIYKRLETAAPPRIKIGEFEILSNDDEDFSAAFVENFLIAGDPSAVKKCVESFAANRGFSFPFNDLTRASSSPPFVRTYSLDENALEFVRIFAGKEAQEKKINPKRRFALTETAWHKGGFRRAVVSDFGILGKIISGFSGS